jgi:hypothetical protein
MIDEPCKGPGAGAAGIVTAPLKGGATTFQIPTPRSQLQISRHGGRSRVATPLFRF